MRRHAVALALLLAGCSSSSSGNGAPGDAGPEEADAGGDAGADAPDPYASCDVHAAPPAHFADATEAWGLGASGVAATGNRITSPDLDGDGYPDLVVHAISSNARTSLGSGTWLVRVLMNRPKPGGGRTFVDATESSGLFQVRDGDGTELRSAHVAVWGDVDGDGDLDAFSGTYVDPTKPATDPGDRSEILLNDGTGRFSLAPVSDSHPTAAQRWPTTSATFADVDRDGRLDLFVGFWYARYGSSDLGTQARLYAGRGDGTFADVTYERGLRTDGNGFAKGTNHRPAYGVTSCDLDDDGAPELLVSAYGRQWNLLYRNDGAGAFADVGQSSGFAGDDDRDYSDNQFFACYCTLHADQPDCAGVKKPLTVCPTPADAYWNRGSDDQPWRLNGNTFTTWCGDLDGDGRQDLYSAEIRHWWAGGNADGSELLRRVDAGADLKFERPGTAASGLAWPHPTTDWNEGGIMVGGGDLDGDGRQDLYVAASDYPDQFGWLFHQKPDGTFEEVGEAWGVHHGCASGMTLADFDRDGDLDLVVGSGTARDCSALWKTNEVHLYENQTPPHGYLLVRLVGDGKGSNVSAIGARVTVEAGGAKQVREVSGGYGHMGLQNDPSALLFGLGACEGGTVTVQWPDAARTTESFPAVAGGRFVEIRQGEAAPREIARMR